MAKSTKSPNIINTINEIITLAKDREIIHLNIQDESLDGRMFTIKDKKLINFGSCSYLGLEVDQRLKDAGIDAIQRYGAQFSSSRTYVSFPLYEKLEERLERLFGLPVLLSQSTAVGHQAVIPIAVEDEDAVILDHQTHYSMQEVVHKLQLRGIKVTMLRHNRMDELETKIRELSAVKGKIWYFLDGVYSMYGDLAPIHQLVSMLNTHSRLHCYIDDAHGMSWKGINGKGYILSEVDLHPKMILGTSLAKGFGSAGGVFLIPDEKLRTKIRNWGGPLTHSGPQQPAVIGASIASADIHLSNEIYEKQSLLKDKITFCNEVMHHYELPVVATSESPIFFIGLGLTKVGYNMVKRLTESGLFVNLGVFPAVPETCTGIRFTLTNHHKQEDIIQLAESIAHHLPKALKEEGRTRSDIDRAFRHLLKTEHPVSQEAYHSTAPSKSPLSEFTIRYEPTIKNMPAALWDTLLGENGSFDSKTLLLLEKSFSNNVLPEDNWDFHYYMINDKAGKPVIATFFSSLLMKDDLFSSEEVSRSLEEQRRANPYLFTSRTLTMGSVITEGNHIYIDKTNKNWRDAFMLLLDTVWNDQDRLNVANIYLRDFAASDIELRDFLTDQGFIKVEIPETHIWKNTFADKHAFIDSLSHKKRYHLKHDVLNYEHLFTTRIVTKPTDDEINYWYKLYENVVHNNLTINNFKFPHKLFKNIASSDQWEILELNFKPEFDTRAERLPIGVGFICRNTNYCPLLLGIDYTFLNEFKIYKQMLYQTLIRAIEVKSEKVYLGITASLEKRKLDAEAIQTVAYVQMKDNFNMSQISLMPSMQKQRETVKKI